jgi:ATP-dependent helicase HrpA
VVVDDETLYDLYDARLPADVVSARHFDRWWKQTRRTQPDLLTFSTDMLTSALAPDVSEVDYPDTWQQGELTLPLSYRFEPGAADDGVTVTVPVAALPRLDADDFLWQVPGLRLDAVTALIRSLPKPLRRTVVPAPDRARAALAALVPRSEPLLPALERELRAMTGTVVSRQDWDPAAIASHLRMTFRVVDEAGTVVAEGKDLADLRGALAPKLRTTIAVAAASLERSGLTDWTVGHIPRTFAGESGGHAVQGFPALVDDGDTVSLRVLSSQDEQGVRHPIGVRRLLMLTLPSPAASILRELSAEEKLVCARSAYPSVAALLDDSVACAVDSLMGSAVPWEQDDFVTLRVEVRAELADRTRAVFALVLRVLRASLEVEQGLSAQKSLALLPSLTDIRDHLASLVPAGFVSRTGWDHLRDLERYVRALGVRLDRLPERPANDAAAMATMRRLEGELAAARDGSAESVTRVREMLEELRVSLWAQSLGTAFPVSEKRILRAIDTLSG